MEPWPCLLAAVSMLTRSPQTPPATPAPEPRACRSPLTQYCRTCPTYDRSHARLRAMCSGRPYAAGTAATAGARPGLIRGKTASSLARLRGTAPRHPARGTPLDVERAADTLGQVLHLPLGALLDVESGRGMGKRVTLVLRERAEKRLARRGAPTAPRRPASR